MYQGDWIQLSTFDIPPCSLCTGIISIIISGTIACSFSCMLYSKCACVYVRHECCDYGSFFDVLSVPLFFVWRWEEKVTRSLTCSPQGTLIKTIRQPSFTHSPAYFATLKSPPSSCFFNPPFSHFSQCNPTVTAGILHRHLSVQIQQLINK